MWTDITAALKTLLEAISGVGTVLDYAPAVKTLSELRTFFPLDENDKLNAWIIERTSVAIGRKTSLSSQEWTHNFVIQGWITTSGKNASYIDFQNLVESIMNSFSENITLGLANSSVIPLGPTADPINSEFLGDFLCHHVKITVVVRELRTVNYH
jgi:hypothetical protein